LLVALKRATCVYLGEGRLVLVAGNWGLGLFEPEDVADRWQVEEIRVPFRAVSEEEKEIWKEITGLLGGMLPGKSNSQFRWRVDTDSGLPVERAVVLADAAADAALVDHVRALEGGGLSIGHPHLYVLELDGLLGQWTHLLASDTATPTGPRQAAIAVNIGVPDNRLAFVLKR